MQKENKVVFEIFYSLRKVQLLIFIYFNNKIYFYSRSNTFQLVKKFNLIMFISLHTSAIFIANRKAMNSWDYKKEEDQSILNGVINLILWEYGIFLIYGFLILID